MATTTRTKTLVPDSMAPTNPSAEVIKLVTASKVMDLPLKQYEEREAFGHVYPAGAYTDHSLPQVQELVYQLRTLPEKPSYRTIAEAMGLQCSAVSEAICHAFARKNKKGGAWKVSTGARAGREIGEDGNVLPRSEDAEPAKPVKADKPVAEKPAADKKPVADKPVKATAKPA